MKPKADHPAIIAATKRPVRIVAVSPDYALVKSVFGQWTYRHDELRTTSGKRFS